MTGGAAGITGLMAGLGARTAIVLALALIAAAAARKRPAAFRHVVLSSALIGLLLIPLLSLAPVGWRSPLLPAWMSAGSPPAAEPEGSARRIGPEGLAVPLSGPETASVSGIPREVSSAAIPSTSPAAPAESRLLGQASPMPRDLPAASLGDRALGASAPVRGQRAPVLELALALLWGFGLLVLLLRLAAGLAGAARLTSRSVPLEGAAWRSLVSRFAAVIGLRRPVRLKSHAEVLVPLTWGWRKPVVLFPDGAADWPADERSSALYHELSHIKRADFLVMLLVRTSLAVFWWNPLCWIVYRELRKEQEIACDELVLRAGIRPSTYAASLLAFRRSAGLRWNPSAALLGLMGRASFQERLAAILKQRITSMEVSMKTKIMVALTLVAAVALVGTARPVSGREAMDGKTVMVETALPAAAAFDGAFEARTASSPAVAQEKTKEQEKAKAEEKAAQAEKAAEAEKEKALALKKVLVVGKDGKAPVEIKITQGSEVKNLVVDTTVTVTTGKNGEIVITTGEGKEPIVVKGEPLSLEIKGGRFEIVEGKPVLAPGDAKTIKIVKEGGDPGETFVFSSRKPGEAFTLVKPGKDGVEVVVEGGKEGHPAVAWTVKEKDKDRTAWVVKEFSDEPGRATWIARDGKVFAVSPASTEEMLAKVHGLQEQVAAIKAKKMDLTALEESLKELETDLKADAEKLGAMTLKHKDRPGKLAVVEKLRGDAEEGSVAYVVEGRRADNEAAIAESKAAVKVMANEKDNGLITLVFSEKGLDKAAYERALAKLKKALPAGYEIEEADFEEEASSMSFKIAPPKGQAYDKALVEKLVELLRPEKAR